MQTNDQRTSIENKLINALYFMGKISFANIYKVSKFDWERCSSGLLCMFSYLGTDKGVSAMTIVVTGKMLDYDDVFDNTHHSPQIVNKLNAVLPDDIRVFSCSGVSSHPR